MKPARTYAHRVNKAEKFLNGLNDYERTTGYSYNAAYFNLKRMKYLLSLMGDPHLKVRSIHVTGTKGKGSTSNYIASILRAAGIKTGLYTSPHILTFRERIKINNKNISWKELDRLTEEIKPLVEKIEKERKSVFKIEGRDFFHEVTADTHN